MRGEQAVVEDLILERVVSLDEAVALRIRSPSEMVLRDFVDTLLLGLSLYPLDEASSTAYLGLFHRFATVVEPDSLETAPGIDPNLRRTWIEITSGMEKTDREERRRALLTALGAPSCDLREAAMNVRVRTLCSRAVDGLMHPVIAAHEIAAMYFLKSEDGYRSPEVQLHQNIASLYENWRTNKSDRTRYQRQLLDSSGRATWMNSLHSR